jgi:hypothetical protein
LTIGLLLVAAITAGSIAFYRRGQIEDSASGFDDSDPKLPLELEPTESSDRVRVGAIAIPPSVQGQ